MALTLTELQAITEAYYADKMATDIFFKGNILLYKLLGGETGAKTIPGGKTIDVPLEYANLPGGSFNNTTKFDTSRKDVFNKAQFPWAGYYSTITYDLEDKRQNNGDPAIIKLIDAKLRNGQKSIRHQMGSAVYASASTSGKDLLGLGNLFNATSSTAYGGIAEDDMAVWAANVITTAEAISFKVMQEIRRSAAIDDNMEGKPNLYVTTEALKDGFERTLQTQARYSDAKLVNAGFDNILFGGQPVVADNKQTAGTVDALNLNFLDILTHQDYNFTKPQWAHALDDPNTEVGYIQWSGNLICKNRKAHCRHTGLTEPA